MSEKTRRCRIVDAYEQEEGTFIKFAPIRFFDESNHPYVCEQALVEMDNGKVVTVNPGLIHFLN
ncbi:hypothetical protein [Kluyvera georgiana]|uniref:hypothetical protein n=1 Tax=Kluyvera georgiana TaxID=73098 RepID=UPI0007E49E9B|nr:hypothetical protein [Kluyvera georgiana]